MKLFNHSILILGCFISSRCLAQVEVKTDSVRLGSVSANGSVVLYGKMFLKSITPGAAGDSILVRDAAGVIRFIKRSDLKVNALEGWGLSGNSGLTSGNFFGTTTNVDLTFKRNNLTAGFLGINSTSFGNNALSNTKGNQNTALGAQALQINSSGEANTATGFGSLQQNLTGSTNAAYGSFSLTSNSSGSLNVAVGHYSLGKSTVGGSNSSLGAFSLKENISGNANVAIGPYSLANNVSGSQNTAIGAAAGSAPNSGNGNTLIGANANTTTEPIHHAVAIGANAIVGASNSMVLGGLGPDAVKVGIGVPNPQNTLHVVGDARISSLNAAAPPSAIARYVVANQDGVLSIGMPAWGISGNTNALPNTYIGTNDSTPFIVKTQSTERLRVLPTGQVGIGTQLPTSTLDVAGDIKAAQLKLSALNTAPPAALSPGTVGEIRFTPAFIYVCIAPNFWVRAALSTW